MKQRGRPTSKRSRSAFEALSSFVADGPDTDPDDPDAGTVALTVSGGQQVPYEFGSFGELMTSKDGIGLDTASPAQRAIQSAVDGLGVSDKLWANSDVQKVFGKARPEAGTRPDEFYLVSGIRCGKSLHAGGKSIDMALTCSLRQTSGRKLGPGEIPRVSVVSLQKDIARATFHHIIGHLMHSPVLRRRIVGNPTSDSVMLMHPTGRPVEIKVVAGARSGATLVSRWSAGVIFDEAPRMLGQESGIVNLVDLRNAVRFRLLEGSQIWYVGSPYQPAGPVYEAVKKYHGRPSNKVLVVKATSDQMNPEHWTPEVVREAYAADPELAAIELGAKFASPEASMFDAASLEASRRTSPKVLPFDPEREYCAAMDPATRANAWTLVIFTREGNKLRMVLGQEWRPRGEALNPDAVMEEIAAIVHGYGLEVVLSDQWSIDAIRQLGIKHGVFVTQVSTQGKERVNVYMSFARRIEAGLVELTPDPMVVRDLVAVRRRPSADGGVRIVLPVTADGRHCDYAPSVVLAAAQYIEESAPKKEKTATEAIQRAVVDDEDMELEELEAGMYGEELESYGIFFGI